MGEPIGLIHVLCYLERGSVQNLTDGWLLVQGVFRVEGSISVALDIDVLRGKVMIDRVEVLDTA